MLQEKMAARFSRIKECHGLCLRTQVPDQINTNKFGLENTPHTTVFLKARNKIVKRYLENSKSKLSAKEIIVFRI